MEEQGKGVQLQGEQNYPIILSGFSWVMVQETLKNSNVSVYVAPIINAIEKQLAELVIEPETKE